jgi:hypothetical protein
MKPFYAKKGGVVEDNVNDVHSIDGGGSEVDAGAFYKQLTRRFNKFRERLIFQAGALAEFRQAYGAGGRTMFRDLINGFFHFINSNFRLMGELSVKMATDFLQSKRFPEALDDFVAFIRDFVQELRENPKNVDALKQLKATSYAAAKEMKELFADDMLEFPGTVSLYDSKGNLRPLVEIETKAGIEFNVERCNHVWDKIEKLLNVRRKEYEEEATELLRTGLSMEAVFVELQSNHHRKLNVPTVDSLREQLNEDNYPAVCNLYKRLYRQFQWEKGVKYDD